MQSKEEKSYIRYRSQVASYEEVYRILMRMIKKSLQEKYKSSCKVKWLSRYELDLMIDLMIDYYGLKYSKEDTKNKELESKQMKEEILHYLR